MTPVGSPSFGLLLDANDVMPILRFRCAEVISKFELDA
jgi:hypothetical protein